MYSSTRVRSRVEPTGTADASKSLSKITVMTIKANSGQISRCCANRAIRNESKHLLRWQIFFKLAKKNLSRGKERWQSYFKKEMLVSMTYFVKLRLCFYWKTFWIRPFLLKLCFIFTFLGFNFLLCKCTEKHVLKGFFITHLLCFNNKSVKCLHNRARYCG